MFKLIVVSLLKSKLLDKLIKLYIIIIVNFCILKSEKKGKIKKAKIKYEKALEYFLKANAENPANADIFNYLGICSAKLELNENAEIYYLLGLELDNQHKGIKFNLGTFYLGQNRIKDSKEILTSLKDCGCEEYETLKMLVNK